MRELPYVFDLLYDVKSIDQLINLYNNTRHTLESLKDTLEDYPEIKEIVERCG